MFMKTFEEKWTAWLDGQLSGRELAEFEASLPDKAAADAERAEAKKLGTLLKRELSAQALTNDEFFSHQVHERIVRESASQSRERYAEVSTWWTIRRLLWTGTASLAVFLVFAVFCLPGKNSGQPSEFPTQNLNPGLYPVLHPNATVSIFQGKKERG